METQFVPSSYFYFKEKGGVNKYVIKYINANDNN